MLVHRVTTYEEWDNSILEDAKNDFQLDIFFGRSYRYVKIDVAPDGSLYGEINHPRHYRILGYAQVWRVDSRSFKVAFPRHAIRKNLGTYRWQVSSAFYEETHPECSSDGKGHILICVDHVPEHGYITHRR